MIGVPSLFHKGRWLCFYVSGLKMGGVGNRGAGGPWAVGSGGNPTSAVLTIVVHSCYGLIFYIHSMHLL